ncbi:MAG TPA: hypothetical protein VK157_14680 [Phycisphaerales bacterium]|nr:hypothetical protein [Phycisphaerales bacterium]
MQYIKGVSVIAALSLMAGGALAVTKTFNGSVSGDWGTAANWTPSGVPTSADDVIIDAGGVAISVTTDAAARSLVLRRALTLSGQNRMRIFGGGMELQGGTFTIAGGSFGPFGIIFVGGSQQISSSTGNGLIRFVPGQNSISATDCALTIGPGVTIRSAGATGAISIDPSSTLQVLGTIEAASGNITIDGTLLNYNGTQNSLTGGTWLLRGSNINLPAGASVLNIGASTTISFGGGALNGIGNVSANLGTLEFVNGQDRTFAPSGNPGVGTFQNGGTIKLDSGSILTITGNFRTLPNSVIDLTMTGSDVNVQQSRILINGEAQLNNVGRLRVRYNGFLPPDCGTIFQVLTHTSRVAGFGVYESVPAEATANLLFGEVTNTRVQVTGACESENTCDDIDFNNNGVFPEDQDVIDFFTVLAGGTCQ